MCIFRYTVHVAQLLGYVMTIGALPHTHSVPQPLAKQGAHVTGIDVVESNINVAKKHASSDSSLQHLLSYQCCTLEDLIANNPGIGYDCVVASEVIEHVANVDVFTRHLCQVVKVSWLKDYLSVVD